MGIPKFFRMISERFPLINQTSNMGLKPEIDCLYLDMNGIVHTATHANGRDDSTSVSEEKMFLQIFEYIDLLFDLAQPQKLLYMALDGVAPRAKMNQQRQRRFRAGQALQEQIDLRRAEGVSDPYADFGSFDRNCITPGTEFMDRLSAHVQYYIRRKITEDKRWQGIQVIFSGADSIGEGEHKIMAYIRSQRMQHDYNPNLRHCIYGLDADLIMLALVSHEHNTLLLREEVVFGDPGDKFKSRKNLLKPGTFQFLHIGLFREYLHYDLNFAAEADWYDLDRVIDDFVFLSFLAGNDFLPSLPFMSIGLGTLDLLYSVYRTSIVQLGGYITCYGAINIELLIKFFQLLAPHEPQLLQLVNADLAKIEQFKQENMTIDDGEAKPAFDLYNPLGADSNSNLQPITTASQAVKNINLDELFQVGEDGNPITDKERVVDLAKQITADYVAQLEDHLDDSAFNTLSLDDLDRDEPSHNDSYDELIAKGYFYNETTQEFVPLAGPYTLDNYYHRAIPNVARGGQTSVNKLCIEYIEGLYWVYKYYYQCVPSWKWQFPHYSAPLIISLAKVDPADCKFEFDIGQPFTPLQQLMAVLPPQSAGLLPKPLRSLMLSAESPIAHFYPLSFEVDMVGKRWEHEGIAKIPFIEENALINAMNNKVRNLNDPFAKVDAECAASVLMPNESRRNINSEGDMLFHYDPSIHSPYALIEGYTMILRLTSSLPAELLTQYEGNPEKANELFFSHIDHCPVRCTLYVNKEIPFSPEFLMKPYGQYTQDDATPNQQYNHIVAEEVLDNPLVLLKYQGDAIRASIHESFQFDQRYLTGKINSIAKFIPIRLILSQQPVPGFPTLKIVSESYNLSSTLPPARNDQSQLDSSQGSGKRRGGGGGGGGGGRKRYNKKVQEDPEQDTTQQDAAPQAEEAVDGVVTDPLAPTLLISRPPIIVFGKKSLKPSISISFRHDPHISLFQRKFLQQYITNDGLNPPKSSHYPAATTTFNDADFATLLAVADRFPPGRIVWSDFPYLRPGRVEFVCDGQNVAVPNHYHASGSFSRSTTTGFKQIPVTPFHRKVYAAEYPAMIARYKHMLGIDFEPSGVLVCISPLISMRTTLSGQVVPVFDSKYVSRKSAEFTSQNGITQQHGNLNALPGYLFSAPQLCWAAPPTVPDRRWTRTAKLPDSALYAPGTEVVGLSKSTFGYIGQVETFSPNSELTAAPTISVKWSRIPPPVVINRDPNLRNIFYQVAQATKLRYYPAIELARALKINGKTLFAITGSLYFKIGYKEYNIGLQLHSARQSRLLPDYCRYVNQWVTEGDVQQNQRSVGNSGDRWEYSSNAVKLLNVYKSKFPELFSYLEDLQNLDPERTINPAEVLRRAWLSKHQQDPNFVIPFNSHIPPTFLDAYYQQIKSFLDGIGLSGQVMVSTTSKQLNTPSVRAIESMVLGAATKEATDVISITQTNITPQQRASGSGKPIDFKVADLRTVVGSLPYNQSTHKIHQDELGNSSLLPHNQLPATQLYLPSSPHPYNPLQAFVDNGAQTVLSTVSNQSNKQQFFRLCDRIMISRADVRVPVGVTGTIIGLHSQFLPLSADQTEYAEFSLNVQGGESLYLEVLLDKPSLSGTTFHGKCTAPLGVIVQATSVLNLSQPVWMLEDAEFQVTPHQFEHKPFFVKSKPAEEPQQQQQQQQQRQRQPKAQQPVKPVATPTTAVKAVAVVATPDPAPIVTIPALIPVKAAAVVTAAPEPTPVAIVPAGLQPVKATAVAIVPAGLQPVKATPVPAVAAAPVVATPGPDHAVQTGVDDLLGEFGL